MNNRKIGLTYITMALFSLLFVGYIHDEGGILTLVISMVFGFAMIGVLVDGLLIFYGKKSPSGAE